MQLLSLFPLIPCADREESELPLPINTFGTWARIELPRAKPPLEIPAVGAASADTHPVIWNAT